MKIIQIVSRVIVILLFLSVLVLIIAFARGYRIDLRSKTLTPTGIIAISAYPKATKVFLNGVFKGATDLNMTLPPGEYQVEIKKEGYTSWSKQVRLRGELVVALEGLLFPLNPSLSPLTNMGLTKVVPIPQSEKILIFSEQGNPEKDGIYLFDLGKVPISFLTPTKLILLKQTIFDTIGTVDFTKTTVSISPDNKEILLTFPTLPEEISYLLSLDEETKVLTDIEASKATLLAAWEQEKASLRKKILEAYPKEISKIASDSFGIISFSPDELKVFYQAKANVTLPIAINPRLLSTNQTLEERSIEMNNTYVYDRKEDRNYKITHFPQGVDNSTLPEKELEQTDYMQWYSDSKHLVIKEESKISVLDFDDLNKQTIYSGPFDNSFFKVTTDGRIIILTNLNPEANKLPDLYAVGIR